MQGLLEGIPLRDPIKQYLLYRFPRDTDGYVLDFSPTGTRIVHHVAALQNMPAFAKLLIKIEDDDLSDAEGAALINEMTIGGSMPPELQWQVVREWLTMFLQDRLEIVPETFVTRRKPGVRRRGTP